MKNQVVVISGGETFETYDEYLSFLKDFKVDSDYFEEQFGKKGWKDFLEDKLGDKFEVIRLRMPNRENAKYSEWKIWFEKFFPFFNSGIILIGHSLGGIFLAKYLSENDFPKKIKRVFLVAAPFDSLDSEYTLADFSLPDDLSKFTEQGNKIYLYHSEDDPVVPFVDLGKYKKMLPTAKTIIFNNREHFNQEEFPEIIEEIKNLTKLIEK
jgi:hypothetical protein